MAEGFELLVAEFDLLTQPLRGPRRPPRVEWGRVRGVILRMTRRVGDLSKEVRAHWEDLSEDEKEAVRFVLGLFVSQGKAMSPGRAQSRLATPQGKRAVLALRKALGLS
jgi:hypothetical protein